MVELHLLNLCTACFIMPDQSKCIFCCLHLSIIAYCHNYYTGKANGRLIYEDGELRLVYEGGKGDCHGQYERQTIITFTCDTAAGVGVPIYLNESSTCKYLFQWPTSLACASSQAEMQECSIQDDMGKQYDLSGLRATNKNYVYLDAEKKVKYLINVCAGIIHGRGKKTRHMM